MGVRRFDDATEEGIVAAYRSGWTTTTLARAYNCSSSTVSNILKRYEQSTSHRIPESVRQAVIAEYRAGLPYGSIAKKFAIPENTVKRIGHEAGYTRGSGKGIQVRCEALARVYPPLPARTACVTKGRVTVCCLWCGALQRRRHARVETSLTFCSNAHRHALIRYTTEHGIEAERPLIVERLLKAAATCKDGARLRRAAEECRATEAEIQSAMRRARWQ